jgi:phenylacetate-CoA ligase
VFYRSKFSSCGISCQDIKTLEDLTKLPFTSKQDIVQAAGSSRDACGELFCGDPREILRWHRTSGTTGKPVRIADTAEDWNNFADLSAEALYAMGVRREDVVVVAFGYGPFIAFWAYIAGLEKIGATFIPSGGLDTQGRIELIKEFGATVFMSVPSYAIHLGETSRALGIDFSKLTRMRLVIHTGEPATPLMKRKIEELWGVRQGDRVGTTETGGFAFQCPQSPGIYHIQEGFFVPEVIDPANGQRVEPGGEGELVLTPLYRRGMPLLRFKTENLVRSSKIMACKCGRNYLSLEETDNGVVVRRLDKLLKIRGVLIDPIAIENIVRQFEWFGGEYRILFEKKGDMEEIKVLVELKNEMDPSAAQDARIKLAEELKRRIMVRIDVESVPFGELERFEEKAKRIVDLR